MLPELGLLNSPLSFSGTIVFQVDIVEHFKRLINAAICSLRLVIKWLFECSWPRQFLQWRLFRLFVLGYKDSPFDIRAYISIYNRLHSTLFGSSLYEAVLSLGQLQWPSPGWMIFPSPSLCSALGVVQANPALYGGARVDGSIFALPRFLVSSKPRLVSWFLQNLASFPGFFKPRPFSWFHQNLARFLGFFL